jgi:hypothetical protein
MIKLANIKKKEYYDIYIGRENKWLNLPASKWQNPFVMKKESEREEVLKKHMEYMLERKDLLADLKELDGKTLGCYCYSSETGIGKKCHGHNLIELFEKMGN